MGLHQRKTGATCRRPFAKVRPRDRPRMRPASPRRRGTAKSPGRGLGHGSLDSSTSRVPPARPAPVLRRSRSPCSRAPRIPTTNFVVEAPSAEIARKVGDHAEWCRKQVAIAWLGRELPAWPTRCPIKVKPTAGEAGGVTSFGFAGGKVADQVITVEGRVDRILASALPHEVTHTVLAAHFGGPMPRWADEGAALLSEDDREINRHEQIVSISFPGGANSPRPPLLGRGLSRRPDGLLRPGIFGQPLPHRDRRPATIPQIRRRRPQSSAGIPPPASITASPIAASSIAPGAPGTRSPPNRADRGTGQRWS